MGVTSGTPQVYLVFWGAQWGTQSTDPSGNLTFSADAKGGAPYLQTMFKGLGTNNELWSGVMTQYCDGALVASGATSCPTNALRVGYPTGGALAGVYYDNSAVAPSAATQTQIATEAIKASTYFGNTTQAANRYVQYVVLSAPGLNPDNYRTSGFCAWHSATSSVNGTLAYTNLPYVMDRGYSCGQGFVNSPGTLDGYSMVAGHEYAETLTDQLPGGGWTNRTGSSYNGQENADECAWISSGQGASANVTLATGSFAMQSTWSNDTNECDLTHAIVPGGTGIANTVAVSNPGAQNSAAGSATTLQLSATDSDQNATFTYSATGLPAGIKLNAATGLIAGTPTTVGTYSVYVKATDNTGASATANFTWAVAALGGTLSVANPAIPGLGTTVTLTPTLPGNHTLTKVVWRTGRADCLVADGQGQPPATAATGVTVTCNASASGSTTVTATLTDSAAAVKAVTGTLAFSTAVGSRTVTFTGTIDGQPVNGSTVTTCAGMASGIRGVAIDTATGLPIKGLTVLLTRKAPTATVYSTYTAALTGTNGVGTTAVLLGAGYSYGITSNAQTVYKAVPATTTTVTPGTCTPVLTSTSISAASAWYGDTVTVTGPLQRSTSAGLVGIAGARVPVTLTIPATGSTAAKTITLATATTSTDVTNPTFTATFKATAAGAVKIAIPASAGVAATTVDLGTLTVTIPTTAITGSVTPNNVGYGAPVTVTGSLSKTTDSTGPVAGVYVNVTVTPAGKPPTMVGTARTGTDGSFTLTAALRTTGTLNVTYPGAPGLPAATATAGPVTAGTWTPMLVLNASSTAFRAGTVVTFTGSATRTYNGVTQTAGGLLVRVYLQPASGGTPVVLGYVVTSSTGAFTVKAAPNLSGTITANVTGMVGYTNAASAPITVTVS